MEGFKANPKMKSQLACFKEGGFVTKKEFKREEMAEEKRDMAEDKKIAKKAISQHETAKHKGEEKTEIKLKNGGRSKKEKGSVNRYKSGGGVDAAEKGKPSGAKGKTKKVTDKPKKAAAPSKASTKKAETPGKDPGPSGALDPMMMADMGSSMADAPSAAMGSMAGPDEYARGGFINEEPDDATAVPMRPMAPRGRQKRRPMAGTGAISNAERQQILDMFQGGPGMSLPQAAGQPGAAGLGNALNTGPMGAAAPAGAASNIPMSPQESDVLRGLQAVGNFCKGGKAY